MIDVQNVRLIYSEKLPKDAYNKSKNLMVFETSDNSVLLYMTSSPIKVSEEKEYTIKYKTDAKSDASFRRIYNVKILEEECGYGCAISNS